MRPLLSSGSIVMAACFYPRIQSGDIIIFRHNGLEKIKRVREIRGERVFVVGDNSKASTDSRAFGWLDKQVIIGRVIWPLGL